MDVFISSGLRGTGCLERNLKVRQTLAEAGISSFLPQEELPIDIGLSAQTIFAGNLSALRACRCCVFLPEGAGEGAFLEAGIVVGFGKPIIVLSQYPASHFGKMMEGLLFETNARQTSDLDCLPHLVRTLCDVQT